MSIFRVFGDLAGIAKGMSVTLREMFSKTVVEDYPNKKLPNEGAVFQERFRGLHELQRDENGLEKCVACFLCAAACPANCIYIEAADNTEEKRISGAERYARSTTSTTTAASFAATALRPAPRTPSPTATASSSPPSTPATWSIAKRPCWCRCRRTPASRWRRQSR